MNINIFCLLFTLLANSLVVYSDGENSTVIDTVKAVTDNENHQAAPAAARSVENETLVQGRRTGPGLNLIYLNDGPHMEWGWDKWCQLQPKIGNCRDRIIYFYYQAKTDTCREFTYSGCGGNQNKFLTRSDCEQFCRGFGTALESRSLNEMELCSMQPDPGNCLGFLTRYYYDINRGECKEFTFGGCGGNSNRFTNTASCMDRCGRFDKSFPAERTSNKTT